MAGRAHKHTQCQCRNNSWRQRRQQRWRRWLLTRLQVLNSDQAAPALRDNGCLDAMRPHAACLAPLQQLWARHVLGAHAASLIDERNKSRTINKSKPIPCTQWRLSAGFAAHAAAALHIPGLPPLPCDLRTARLRQPHSRTFTGARQQRFKTGITSHGSLAACRTAQATSAHALLAFAVAGCTGSCAAAALGELWLPWECVLDPREPCVCVLYQIESPIQTRGQKSSQAAWSGAANRLVANTQG